VKISTRALYLIWGAVAVFSFCAQGTYTADVIRLMAGRYPAPPFTLGDPWPSLRDPWPQAIAAGLQPGDRLLAIDGVAPRGQVDLAALLHDRGVGGTLDVTAQRGGTILHAKVSLVRSPMDPSWSYAAVAWIIMPVVAVLLGLWVAAARPRDVRAWLMLGILLGMSQITRINALDPLGWGRIAGMPGVLLSNAGVSVWALSMLFFGVYFPQRWSVDRKLPWIKWLLAAGPVYVLFAAVPASIAAAVDYPLLERLPGRHTSDGIFLACLCPAISIFFVAISHKYNDSTSGADDRRRLKLLYWGCTAGMTPLFLSIMFNLATRRMLFGGFGYAVALMLVVIFPLTMAYVVVVERALDVRVVIRQGVQYALARRGVRIVQGLVAAGVMALAVSYGDSSHASRPQRLMLMGVGVFVIIRIRQGGHYLSRWVDRRFFREAYNAEQILRDLSEQVRGILDHHALLETVARKISESLHVERIAVMLREGGVFRPALALGYAVPPPAAAEAEAAAGELVLPLKSRKEVLGYIALGPKKSEEPYSPNDTRLLETVAAQTGLALENARLSEQIASEMAQRETLARELEIAREVQERLFPQVLPEVPALEYAGHCRPARAVGGDYYDFLALSSGRLGLVIGDVSGKGVPAALLMASLQASVRGQAEGVASVAALMANVNRLVCDASPENRYATFFYAQFDPATRRLLYSNGGHNPPIVLRGGEALRLETGGPPVGLFRFSQYSQDEIALEPGDLLVLFTDGVSEAENPAEDEWGEDALIAAARACERLPPVEAIARIMRAADDFAAGAPQHDDMTLVVAKVL
jgi:sigma-B regulation protein RsbU (phosphoserine phosphatase)